MISVFGSPRFAQDLKGKPVGCFLCGGQLQIRLTKKDRPYWICNDCGTQVFVRGDKGIARLKALVKNASQ
jgi:hypothetical protein